MSAIHSKKFHSWGYFLKNYDDRGNDGVVCREMGLYKRHTLKI